MKSFSSFYHYNIFICCVSPRYDRPKGAFISQTVNISPTIYIHILQFKRCIILCLLLLIIEI